MKNHQIGSAILLWLAPVVAAANQPCSSPDHCKLIAGEASPEVAIEALKYAFSRWPKAPGIATEYGARLLSNRDFSRAQQVYGSCLDGQNTTATYVCRVGKAIALMNLGFPEQANALLTRPVDSAITTGSYSPAIVWKIHVLIDLGFLQEAVYLIDQADSLSRSAASRAPLLIERARLALATKDGETALRFARMAKELSTNAEYQLALALILAWNGSFDTCRSELAEFDIAGLPDSTKDIPDLLGDAISGSDSAEPFEGQIQSHPREQAGWFCAGLRYFRRGELESAIETFELGESSAISTILLRPKWLPDDSKR